jgi:molecular chaperone GrpE (heat shock protein)
MLEPIPNIDSDFSAQLQALVIEAEQTRDLHSHSKEDAKKHITDSDIQRMLKPITSGIEALQRSQAEQLNSLAKLDKIAVASEGVPIALAEARHAMESRNTVSKAMFEALHAELKSYKDAFILESVLRPVIRDMISVYDDMSEIHRQLSLTVTTFGDQDLAGEAVSLVENTRNAITNLDHNVHFILEVLERLDVLFTPVSTGKLDKKTQKAMSLEHTDNPDEDQQIVRILKRGFHWKERIIRPEEVVIKKWKEGAQQTAGSEPSQQ